MFQILIFITIMALQSILLIVSAGPIINLDASLMGIESDGESNVHNTSQPVRRSRFPRNHTWPLESPSVALINHDVFSTESDSDEDSESKKSSRFCEITSRSISREVSGSSLNFSPHLSDQFNPFIIFTDPIDD